tara:strand:+ start:66 stop:407 length:342 start_codon:yes stop_codon:yes gene_type:complete
MPTKKTSQVRTGAQFYQSDDEKRATLSGGGQTKAKKAISKALKEKYLSGDISRKEYISSGGLEAKIIVDSIEDSVKRPPKKSSIGKAKGGFVRAFNNGGAVMSGRGPKFKGVN